MGLGGYLFAIGFYATMLWMYNSYCQAKFTADLHIQDGVLHRADERFLSVALGSTQICQGVEHLRLESPVIRTLLKGLAPAYFRIGGTEADGTAFVPPGEAPLLPQGYTPTCYVDGRSLSVLFEFALSAGMPVLYGLNALMQDLDGTWYPGNTQQLLKYSIKMGYSHNLNFELGNEPDIYHVKFNRTINGTHLGKEFLAMKDTVRMFGDYFRNAIFVGPDVATTHENAQEISIDWLNTVGNQTYAYTFHHYYFDGANRTVEDFLNPANMDSLYDVIATHKKWVKSSKRSDVRMWLGESGVAWDGGTKDIQQHYVSSFLYLDTLGVAAKSGLDIAVRFTWYGGYHGLLNYTFHPTTDYWMVYVYNQLVGETVLTVTSTGLPIETHPRFRVYAHCTKSGGVYKPGAVTVYGMNIYKYTEVKVQLPDLKVQPLHVYLMTPGDDKGLTSSVISVNGRRLDLVNMTSLPPLVPLVSTASAGFTLPPRTYGFFVLPEAGLSACVT